MTRKDYELIAGVIRAAFDPYGSGLPTETTTSKARVINEFAYALREENPRFNAQRFIEACNKERT